LFTLLLTSWWAKASLQLAPVLEKRKSKRPKASKKSGDNLAVAFSTNVTKKGGETAVGSVTLEEIMATASESDSGDTPHLAAVEICNSLGINEGTQILLGICWSTGKQRQLLALFPEAVSSDFAFEANNEKRPSIHVCGHTSMNETFGGLCGFLPSQSACAFCWSCGVAVPALVDKHFMERNNLVVTDGDEKIFHSREKQIPVQHKGSVHCLCAFH
jgi:hypothetical protein